MQPRPSAPFHSISIDSFHQERLLQQTGDGDGGNWAEEIRDGKLLPPQHWFGGEHGKQIGATECKSTFTCAW